MSEVLAMSKNMRIPYYITRASGTWGVLALLLVGLWISKPTFYSTENLANIGLQSSVLLLLALPMTIIILTEGLDLSMGSLLGLAGMCGAWGLSKGVSLETAFVISIAVGLLGGLWNGFVIAKLSVPPFVATLGTMGIAHGLAVAMTDGQSIVEVGDILPRVFSSSLIGIPTPLLIALAAYGVSHFLLYRTRFGSAVFALGGNRDAWMLAGGNINKCLVGVYLFAGGMVGVAAMLFASRMSAGHPTASVGMEFDAMAAVALGGTSFEKGNGWLFGTVLGVVTIGVLRNGLNLLGFSSSVQVMSIGLLLLLSLSFNVFKREAA